MVVHHVNAFVASCAVVDHGGLGRAAGFAGFRRRGIALWGQLGEFSVLALLVLWRNARVQHGGEVVVPDHEGGYARS